MIKLPRLPDLDIIAQFKAGRTLPAKPVGGMFALLTPPPCQGTVITRRPEVRRDFSTSDSISVIKDERLDYSTRTTCLTTPSDAALISRSSQTLKSVAATGV